MRLLVSLALLSLSGAIITPVSAAPQFPKAGISRVEQTRRALEMLAAATDAKARHRAIQSLPFGTASWSNEDVHLHTQRPWEPFDRSQSGLREQYSLIPAALRILQRWQKPPKNDIEGQERNTDVTLAATVLATIGGRKTIQDALPVLLQSLARINGAGDFVTQWEVTNCLVTLCGANDVAREIAAQTRSSDPTVRAAAMTVLGTRGKLLGDNHVEKMPNGKHRPLPAQSATRDAFVQQMSVMARIAARDESPVVRLAALDALYNATYGAQNAPWGMIYPLLIEAQDREDASPASRLRIARLCAVIPQNPMPLLPLIRRLLRDEIATTKWYAASAMDRVIAYGNQETVTRMYITQLRSNDMQTRRNAVIELVTAVNSIWGYNDWTWHEIIPRDDNFDSRWRDAMPRASDRRWENPQPSATLRQHRDLLAALIYVVKNDKRPDVKQLAAQSVEHTGRAVNVTLGHGGRFRIAEPDMPLVRDALKQASQAIRSTNPVFSDRLSQLATRVNTPHDRF